MGERMKARVERLEAARPAVIGRWHRITVRPGQSDEEAIDVYGRDRIGGADHVVIRRIVKALGPESQLC